MPVVLDTDIVSCFAKIDRLDFLRALFSSRILLPNRVYEELLRAKELGYRFVDKILDALDEDWIEIALLSKDEIEEIQKLDKEGKFGFGEIEAATICMHRESCILLSNDDLINKEFPKKGIEVFNLEDLLSLAIDECIIKNLEELEDLVDAIQSKDKIKIRNYDVLVKKCEKRGR